MSAIGVVPALRGARVAFASCRMNMQVTGNMMKRNGTVLGLDFARLERLGDEARDRVYAALKVRKTRV